MGREDNPREPSPRSSRAVVVGAKNGKGKGHERPARGSARIDVMGETVGQSCFCGQLFVCQIDAVVICPAARPSSTAWRQGSLSAERAVPQ